MSVEDYFVTIILIASILSAIFFTVQLIRKRNWKFFLGLGISLLPLGLATAFIWFLVVRPYKLRHSDDHEYFGEYVFVKTEGTKDMSVISASRLTLHPDFTYTFTHFKESGFPMKGKWKACWTDDCKFGFNYDKPVRFYASQEQDSTKLLLKIMKTTDSKTAFVFQRDL
jgi:hypothetical protein